MDAVGAEHVRDLVRVGDDRGRAERQDEARELVDQELRRLDVKMRVDEPGDQVAPGRVDRLAALVVAEPGDDAVDDRDVALEPFAREDAEDTARRGSRCRPARPLAQQRVVFRDRPATCPDDRSLSAVWLALSPDGPDFLMRIRIERRLNQPRWLTVAVPVASVLVAFVLGGIVLLITGHNPLTTYKQLFEAGFIADRVRSGRR